jgi:hypothetical protein
LERLIDLHTHTSASDGSFSPAHLVRAAAAAELSAVAVTDHDITSGVAEALTEGREAGIEVVPGVEVSAEWKPGQMHIVGLFIDPADKGLIGWLGEILAGRNTRNARIVERLRELGIDITLDEVLAVAGEGAVGRPHFAQVLIEKGAVRTRQEAFDRFLAKGTPGYVDRVRATPEDAIARIHAAGGLAVLAHINYCGHRNDAELRAWVTQLKDAGLDGIETRYQTYTLEDETLADALADEFDLAPSGGSDFHGADMPGVELGTGRGNLRVPYQFLNALRTRLRP